MSAPMAISPNADILMIAPHIGEQQHPAKGFDGYLKDEQTPQKQQIGPVGIMLAIVILDPDMDAISDDGGYAIKGRGILCVMRLGAAKPQYGERRPHGDQPRYECRDVRPTGRLQLRYHQISILRVG
jgi:hypothetical protein